MVRAFYLDSSDNEVANSNVELSHLQGLGVEYWTVDPSKVEKGENPVLDKICQERGYTYRDFVDSRKIPDLQGKLKMFFEEHLHDDEEIRFFLDGSGYFDIRDQKNNDQWIRIELKKGEMITVPAGIYHRFNPDKNMFFHVMRLFVGDPVWTAWNRAESATEERKARKEYLGQYGQ